ncbi:Lysophospholipase L1 [Tessaracoccus bendigoensis DSM 12906]|uniref:Lysophospholipase L1 n=1 Tax=Tessaracoccus bendigoensis DSM 12906 TaxID=1123357 RepID=A0A1M6AFQ3_9ACTN|nr:GDSL-type esterase/lipase family protein [Tessaracoccus bendigoensis]SHI35241.1 Lysophospholipase L1 [Tessaracoccus bendigoensis DSM 12906]
MSQSLGKKPGERRRRDARACETDPQVLSKAPTTAAPTLVLGALIVSGAGRAEVASRQTLGWGFAARASASEFDGTRHDGLWNSSHADVAGSAALSAGTVQVSFTPRSAAGRQTIAHFYSSAVPESGVILGIDATSIFWRVGADEVTVPVSLTLNRAHQIHATVTEGRLRIFLDASPVYFGDSIGFLASVAGVNSFDIGGRNTGGQDSYADFFTGTLQRLTVLDGPLTPSEMKTVNQNNRFPVALDDFSALAAQVSPTKIAPATWVFTGDSITNGNVHTYGMRSWSEQFAQRLVEIGLGDDTVINTGISGDTSVATSTTLGVNTRFEDRVGAYDPDVVVVMLGMNDSSTALGIARETYLANMGEIVDKIREVGATPVLAASNPICSEAEAGQRSAYPAYVQGLRALAASKQVVLVDHFADWLTQPGGAMPTAWFGDAIHPNGLGHWQLTRTLFQTIGGWDPASGIGAESDTPVNGFIEGSALELPLTTALTQSYGYGFCGAFDGSRVEDRSVDLAAYPMHRQFEGTYAVKFTTSSAATGVLLGISDSTRSDTALTIRSVAGGVRALITRGGMVLLDLDSGDLGLADGAQHTVMLSAGNGTTRLTVDGRVVGFSATQRFGADAGSADTLTVGALKNDSGTSTGFVGSIAWVYALTEPTEPVQQFTLTGGNAVSRSADLTQLLGTLSQTGASWQQFESRPITILTEDLQAPSGGWRRWTDNLQELHRGERNYRQDYVVTVNPGATSVSARVGWFLAQGRLSASRMVILQALDADLAAAGEASSYRTLLTGAVTTLRSATRLPVLMTSVTADAETNSAMRCAAAASGAVLIDSEAEALQVGSGAVPASWLKADELSALGHERVTFRVLKDLGIWAGSDSLADSHPLAPARGVLAVPGGALTVKAGGSVVVPVSVAIDGTAHDVAFGIHAAGGAAEVTDISGATVSGSTGRDANLSIGGAHSGTVQAVATVRVPADAVVGSTVQVVINASLGNQRARFPGKVVNLSVVCGDTSMPLREAGSRNERTGP